MFLSAPIIIQTETSARVAWVRSCGPLFVFQHGGTNALPPSERRKFDPCPCQPMPCLHGVHSSLSQAYRHSMPCHGQRGVHISAKGVPADTSFARNYDISLHQKHLSKPHILTLQASGKYGAQNNVSCFMGEASLSV
jgi:hypothetical protein